MVATREPSPVEFKAEFSRIADALKPLRAQAAERFRQTAPEFNVFRILRLAGVAGNAPTTARAGR